MRPIGNIYLRIFLPFLGVLLIAMLCAWWIAVGVLSATLDGRLNAQMDNAADVLAGGLLPLTEELLRRTSELLQADVVLLDAQGAVVASTLPLAQDLEAAFSAQVRAGVAQAEIDQLRILVRRLAVGNDARFAAVAIIADLRDVRRAAARAAVLLAIATAGAALVLAIAGHYLARSITMPIRELSGMAERLAAGERGVRVEVHPPNEIGALAGALNNMAEKLAEYEAALEAQSRLSALGELSARIAHEIRNPLTAIKLKLQLLAEANSGNDSTEFHRLLNEIDRLELIVNSALAVAKPQSLTTMPSDLNAVIDEVTDLVAPQLAHQRIAFERVLADVPKALLDDDRVKQILFNLLNNAAAAQPAGGAIRVSSRLSRDGTAICMVVEDSGPGLADATYAELQSSSPSATNSHLGLGLKLCKELVELHRGVFEVGRSPDLGGARFTVCFPTSIIA